LGYVIVPRRGDISEKTGNNEIELILKKFIG
jgi:hypothetical protein